MVDLFGDLKRQNFVISVASAIDLIVKIKKASE